MTTIDKSPLDIAQDLRKLSDHMLDVATDMDYYGGFDEAIQIHAKQLLGASAIALGWAQGIEHDAKNHSYQRKQRKGYRPKKHIKPCKPTQAL